MGRGRHVTVLAEAGLRVFGVDRNLDALRSAVERAAAMGHRLHAWCADLAIAGLPRQAFEVIVVTRYLQRDLFAPIRDALAPGGVVLYETFTCHQRPLGFGPTSPDHLLETGELRERFDGLEIVFYEEVRSPEAVARFVGVQRDRARDRAFSRP